MATRLYFRFDAATAQQWGGAEAGLSDSTVVTPDALMNQGGWSTRSFRTIRGASSTSLSRTTITGPSAGIEFKSGTHWQQWFTPLIDTGGTITSGDTITASLWGSESDVLANCAINVVLEKVDGRTGAYTTIAKSASTSELTLSSVAYSLSFTASATVVLARGDRIRARVFLADGGTAGTSVPTFVASGALHTVASGGAIGTVALPAGLAANDMMILQALVRANGVTVATPAGWTPLVGQAVRAATATYAWFWKQWASGDVAPSLGCALDELQTVTITGAPTGGTFTLTFGANTTTALAIGSTAAQVQTALQALASIGSGNCLVTGANGGPFTVEFTGAKANTNVAAMTAANTFTGGTTPGVTIATTQDGSPGTTGDRYAMISAYRGVSAVGVVSAVASATTAGVTDASITTTKANSLIVCSTCGESNTAASVAYAGTSPATLTANTYLETTTGGNGAVAIGSAGKAVAGATGAVTATWSATVVGEAAVLFSLSPADGGTMAPNFSGSFAFDGPTSLASGDSWVEFANSFTFYESPEAQTVALPGGQRMYYTTQGGFAPGKVLSANPSEWWQRSETPLDGPWAGTEITDGSPVQTLPFGVATLLGGLVLAQATTYLNVSSCQSSGARCSLDWWNPGTSTWTVWAATQMSPMQSLGRGSALGYLGTGGFVDLEGTAYFWLVGDPVTIPVGGMVRFRFWIDDSYRNGVQVCPVGHPNAGTTIIQLFNLGGAESSPVGDVDSYINFTNPLHSTFFDQFIERGRNDDGGEAAATWKAAENVGWTQPLDTVFRARVAIEELGGLAPPAKTFKLQASVSGGAYFDVTATSTKIRSAASATVVDGVATTHQTSQVATYVAGEFDSSGAMAATETIGSYGSTELEWCLTARSADLVGGEAVLFRVVESTGTLFGSYSGNPTVTISTPAAGASSARRGGIWLSALTF